MQLPRDSDTGLCFYLAFLVSLIRRIDPVQGLARLSLIDPSGLKNELFLIFGQYWIVYACHKSYGSRSILLRRYLCPLTPPQCFLIELLCGASESLLKSLGCFRALLRHIQEDALRNKKKNFC